MIANDNLRGALFMALAMLGFAFEDVFYKTAVTTLPAGQVSLMVGLIGMGVFGCMALLRDEALFDPVMLSPPMLIRSSLEIGGRLFYALAIALTPLSLTSAILQATPLVVVAGAALFLRESVGWRRWCAILVGFVGVLIILRPGFEGFSALSLLAVLGMAGFAGRDLATRVAPKSLSNRQLGLMGFAMLAASGAILMAIQGHAVLPDAQSLLWVGCDALFAVLGYHALTTAMRVGDVSFISPFRYTRLIFALILARVVFGESPDRWMLIGAALIVASGLYTLFRQNHRLNPR